MIHLATAAVVNAVWDLWAKAEGKPVWKLLVDMSPEELVRCLDFRYVTDALTPEEALAILRRNAADQGRARDGDARATAIRLTRLRPAGSATTTTRSAASRAKASRRAGRISSMKVGGDLDDDVRRARILREEIGPDRKLMMDANQVWEVDEAIAEHAAARRVRSVVDRRADEPRRHPRPRGDPRGAVAPIGVATGEHCHNRVMFKQLLQARGDRLLPGRQLPARRSERSPGVLLMAAKFGVPVCPHAGGVGLMRVRAASFDVRLRVRVGVLENRVLEYVDHLHEHFVDRDGRRSALCRSRTFRQEPDSGGVDRARVPVAGAELSRTGRACARASGGDRKPVLPALSRLGADPDRDHRNTATIIASQAVITGAFSLSRQAIQLGLLPRLDVRHTSDEHAGQIFMPQINLMLLIGVIFLVVLFGSSSSLRPPTASPSRAPWW